MTLLQTHKLSAFYGDFQALFDINATVEEGETVAVIGANGAGKTTFLRAVAGALATAPETVMFDGRPIGHLTPHEIVRLGIAMVPEGRRLFPSLSVEENLLLGTHSERDGAVESQARLSTVSEALRVARAAGAVALGRTAADGGDRPRADVQSAAAALRRAVARARAGGHPRHL